MQGVKEISVESRRRLDEVVANFVRDESVKSYALPPLLSGVERKYVHTLCERHGFTTQSFGEGQNRYVYIHRVPELLRLDVPVLPSSTEEPEEVLCVEVMIAEESRRIIIETFREAIGGWMKLDARKCILCVGLTSTDRRSVQSDIRQVLVDHVRRGQRVIFRGVCVLRTEKVFALGVVLPNYAPSTYRTPHIIVAHGEVPDWRHELDFEFWRPLGSDEHMTLEGTVAEFTLKPVPQRNAADPSSPAPCSNPWCAFACTAQGESSCCKMCSLEPGEHSKLCQRRPAPQYVAPRTAESSEGRVGVRTATTSRALESEQRVCRVRGCSFPVAPDSYYCTQCGGGASASRPAGEAGDVGEVAGETILRCQSAGCTYVCTGVVARERFCCWYCRTTPNQHGLKCARRPAPGAPMAPAAPCAPEAPEANRAAPMAGGAPVAAASATAAAGGGVAGTPAAASAAAPAAAPAAAAAGAGAPVRLASGEGLETGGFGGGRQEATTPGPVKCASADCSFAVTGICAGHCCKRCAEAPNTHGKKCMRQPAESSGAARLAWPVEPAAAGSTWSARPAAAEPAKNAGLWLGDESLRCRTPDCPFVPTGVALGYCCKMCREIPGQHGKLCERVRPSMTGQPDHGYATAIAYRGA